MKKLLLIALLIVGAFAEDDTNDIIHLIDGSIFKGQYISMNNKKVIFKPIGYLAGSHIDLEKIKLVKLKDGTVIYDINTSFSSNYFTNAGNELISFSNDFYGADILYTFSYLVTTISAIGIMSTDPRTFKPPYYVGAIIGSGLNIYALHLKYTSFKKIGKAGEELIKEGKQNN